MSLGIAGLLVGVALAVGDPDGLKAAGLGLVAAVGTRLLVPVVDHRAGPVGGYAVAIGLRLGVMLGGGSFLVLGRQVESETAFWSWLLAVYLTGLVTQTLVSARSRGRKG